MTIMERRSLPTLRKRLFLSVLLIVALSVGVTFVVGLVLTRRSVEHANLDDLGHQADLLARREQGALYAFSNVASLKPFLEKQHERLDVYRLKSPPAYLPAEVARQIRADKPARGSVNVGGERYLFAARRAQTKGFVLLRPASLEAAGWGTYLRALAVAGAIGAALAAIASFFTARAITRPVRRVAEASRSLAEVAREAVRRYEPEARACGVELEAIADGAAPAEADPDRALQVVSNLVENALRSTPPGGSVRVHAEPGRLAVEDTGRGLPPEDLARAFERFYLYDRAPGQRRIGTGLGLAIVKELSERMGGTVTVESTPGQGTTFTVRLPASPRVVTADGSRARSGVPDMARSPASR